MQIRPLRIATVTINNGCNLRCPHCYLQYGQPDHLISDEFFRAILASSARRIILVGMEPLRDRDTVRATERLIGLTRKARKRAAIITNGVCLNLLSEESARRLDYIDVSFDGGPKTYKGFRDASYDRLVRNITQHAQHDVKFRALHVLCDSNLEHVDDMIQVADIPGMEAVVFSLYVEARNHGTTRTRLESVQRAVDAVAGSQAFRSCDRAILLLARHELGLNDPQFDSFIRKLRRRLPPWSVQVIHRDPLQLGIARFTYDDLALTPLQSVHPADYATCGIKWTGQPIDEIWRQLNSPLTNVLAVQSA